MVSRSWWCAAVLCLASGEVFAQRGGNQQQGAPIGGGRSGAPSAPAPTPRSAAPAAPPRAAPAPAPAPRPSAPPPSPAAGGSRGGIARPSPAPAPSPSAGAVDRVPTPAGRGGGGTAGRGGVASPDRGGATGAPSGGARTPTGDGQRGRGGFTRTPTAPTPDLPGGAGGGSRARGDGAAAVDRSGGAAPAAPPAPRTRGNYEHRGYNRGGTTGGGKLADDSAAAGRGAGGTPRSRVPTAPRLDAVADRPAAVRPITAARPAPAAAAPRAGGAGPAVVAGGVGASWAGNLYAGSGPQLNLTYATGVGTSSALLHAHYGRNYSPWYGCAPYRFDPFWSLPHWPTYTTWYGRASWTPWYSPYGGYAGYAYPCGTGFYSHYRSHRWSVGFGFNVCRSYGSTWYPCYRRYSYLPFYYYSTVAFYPAYSTVYVHDVATASYADASDPYVEYEEAATAEAPAVVGAGRAGGGLAGGAGDAPSAAGARLAPVSTLPATFAEALVPEYPAGLSAADYAARADVELASGRYFDAAEARRRAWEADPREATHPLRLGYALFAAGRYDLAAAAFRAAFELDPYAHRRRDSLDRVLGSAESYRRARLAVERRVFREPNDADARLVLAVAAFMNADDFAARTEFNALVGKERFAEVFRDEAARRLVADER